MIGSGSGVRGGGAVRVRLPLDGSPVAVRDAVTPKERAAVLEAGPGAEGCADGRAGVALPVRWREPFAGAAAVETLSSLPSDLGQASQLAESGDLGCPTCRLRDPRPRAALAALARGMVARAAAAGGISRPLVYASVGSQLLLADLWLLEALAADGQAFSDVVAIDPLYAGDPFKCCRAQAAFANYLAALPGSPKLRLFAHCAEYVQAASRFAVPRADVLVCCDARAAETDVDAAKAAVLAPGGVALWLSHNRSSARDPNATASLRAEQRLPTRAARMLTLGVRPPGSPEVAAALAAEWCGADAAAECLVEQRLGSVMRALGAPRQRRAAAPVASTAVPMGNAGDMGDIG